MQRKSAIIATLGPKRAIANDNADKLKEFSTTSQAKLFLAAGANVLRINFSHIKDTKARDETVTMIREMTLGNYAPKGQSFAVMPDLQGPKIRLGQFPESSVPIHIGQRFNLHTQDMVEGNPDGVSVLLDNKPFTKLYQAVEQALKTRKDIDILLGDGEVLLKLTGQGLKPGGVLETEVRSGTSIGSYKGITPANVPMEAPSCTRKDLEDLALLLPECGIASPITAVCQSFVKRAEDAITLKYRMWQWFKQREPEQLEQWGLECLPWVISKIETPQAIENLDDILLCSDGVMVARGDLGLQLDPESIPYLQQEIIRRGNLLGRPVITATEMLASMEQSLRPRRSEVTDVHEAVREGSSCVMLSGETSNGMYPLQAIAMMDRIARAAEKEQARAQTLESLAETRESSQKYKRQLLERMKTLRDEVRNLTEDEFADLFLQELVHNVGSGKGDTDRISYAAAFLAQDPEIHSIIAPSYTGRTARMVSRFFPRARVLAAVPNQLAARRMTFVRGVTPIVVGTHEKEATRLIEQAAHQAKQQAQLTTGDRALVISGIPLFRPGTMNNLSIIEV